MTDLATAPTLAPVPDPRHTLPLLLSVKDSAAVLGVGRDTVYDLERRGEISFLHPTPGRTLVAYADLVEYVDRLRGAQRGGGWETRT